MSARWLAAVGALAVAGLGGCGGSSPTSATDGTDSTTTLSSVTQSVSPDPATSRPSDDPSYQWTASFRLTLVQADGATVLIRAVSADLQQASAGVVVPPAAGEDEAFRFQLRGSGNQLVADGTVAMDFDFAYTLPNGGREALVTINLALVDAQGATATRTVQARVL